MSMALACVIADVGGRDLRGLAAAFAGPAPVVLKRLSCGIIRAGDDILGVYWQRTSSRKMMMSGSKSKMKRTNQCAEAPVFPAVVE